MQVDIRVSKDAWKKFKIKVIQENTSIANKLGEMIEREVIEYRKEEFTISDGSGKNVDVKA